MRQRSLLPLLTLVLAGLGCDSREPVRLTLPVRTASGALASTTNSADWEVQVASVRLVAIDLELTQLGEQHARVGPRLLGLLVPTAHAHPGHDAAGTVTGTLPGTSVLSFPADGGVGELGMATVLAGNYRGMNFTFGTADEDSGVASDDPLTGVSAHVVGTASRAGEALAFEARVAIAARSRMVGGTFETSLTPESRGALVWELLTHDPIKDASLFEGLDFERLPRGEDGRALIHPGDDAHNILRRTLQDHAFHRLTFHPET